MDVNVKFSEEGAWHGTAEPKSQDAGQSPNEKAANGEKETQQACSTTAEPQPVIDYSACMSLTPNLPSTKDSRPKQEEEWYWENSRVKRAEEANTALTQSQTNTE